MRFNANQVIKFDKLILLILELLQNSIDFQKYPAKLCVFSYIYPQLRISLHLLPSLVSCH